MLVLAGTCATAAAAPVFTEPDYNLVYELAIPNAANDVTSAVGYEVNNAAIIPNGSFDHVGYMMQLQSTSGELEYVSVSMSAFTNNASMLGVPTVASGERYLDTPVTGMNVLSNVPGVATGYGFTSGFVQFWPDCYSYVGSNYATGRDLIQSGTQCYGSMQIGNGTGTTVFAYNNWDGVGNSDLGIGNAPSGNTDWTFAFNTADYTVKDLTVWVAELPEPAGIAIMLTGIVGVRLVRRRGRISVQRYRSAHSAPARGPDTYSTA